MVQHSSTPEAEPRQNSIALNAKRLSRALKSDSRLRHARVYPFDGWNPSAQGGSIVNTAKRREKGRHWVAFWVKGKEIFFFDSAGHSPEHYGFDLSGYRYRYNGVRWQSLGTAYCGYYCLFFLWHRARDIVHSKLMARYKDKDLRRNDLLVYIGCRRFMFV